MKSLEDKNPRMNNGMTPLHFAAQLGHLEVCKLICQNIVDINPSDDTGRTPLDIAYTNRNLEIVSYLFKTLKEFD